MDCETEEPPTSIIPPAESNFSMVIFTNVQKFYPPKTDVQCKFRREENFECSPKDWIGIFKVGWKSTREYYTWISARTSEDNTVLFTAYYLPKDDDYYQFCYVDQNGEVRGASIPFQFCHNIQEDEEDILMVTTEMEMMRTNEENAELKKVVGRLKEENLVLQEKVSSLQNENQAGRIQNLQDDLLSSTVKIQRLETENMELTIENKNLEDEVERMNKTIQSLDMDLQMQRSQEEKLLSEIKQMERSKDNIQEERRYFEKLQIHIKTLQEEKENLEADLKLYTEKEQKLLSHREELEKSLEQSVAEKHHFQNEDKARQKIVENLTYTVNQCKEETVKLKAELELQTCTLQKEKTQNEKQRQLLDKESKKACELERNMEQKNEKLRSAEDTLTSLYKQVDLLKGENENKMKQMGMLHITIANLEGDVKRMKVECMIKMEAERTVKELKSQLKSTAEKMDGLELQLAREQDINRQQGEEILTLRSALELQEEEICDMKHMDRKEFHVTRNQRDSRLSPNQGLLYGNPYKGNDPSFFREHGSSSTSRRSSSPLSCPVCEKTFLPDEHQILEDHVLCHYVDDEAGPYSCS